jgi:hypothetical protein
LHFKLGSLHVNCARSRFAEAQSCTIQRTEETLNLIGFGEEAFGFLEFQYVRGEYRYRAYDLADELWQLVVDMQDGSVETAGNSLGLVKKRWQDFRRDEIERRCDLLGIPKLPDVGKFTLSAECQLAFDSLMTENTMESRPYLYQEVAEKTQRTSEPIVDKYYKILEAMPRDTSLYIEQNPEKVQELLDTLKRMDKAEAAMLLFIENLRVKMRSIPPDKQRQYLSWKISN